MFQFDELNHVYTLDGKPLKGTTTVLQVISKPALIPWAVKLCGDYILDQVAKGVAITKDVVDEAKRQHKKKKEAAGDWGTTLHKHIENFVKDQQVPKLEGEMKQAFEHFVQWSLTNNAKFLESELRMFSREMWVGGTCDILVNIGGMVWLVDIKTSSAIYPEQFLQMGSYDVCLNEMGKHTKIDGYIILNLKKDGTFDEKRCAATETCKAGFKHALGLTGALETLKASIQ